MGRKLGGSPPITSCSHWGPPSRTLAQAVVQAALLVLSNNSYGHGNTYSVIRYKTPLHTPSMNSFFDSLDMYGLRPYYVLSVVQTNLQSLSH